MKLPEGFTQKVAKSVLSAKHNSPHIFFAAGVVGIVGAGFMACKATLKLDQKLDEAKNDIEKARAKTEKTSTALVRHGHDDSRRELGIVYVKSAAKVSALYLPAGVLAAASIAALAGSHVQLTRRNAALSSSLAGALEGWRQYRERVREEIGEERENEIYRNIRTEELVSSDGQKQLVKVTDNPNAHSPWARFFDEASVHWVKNRECNLMFVQHQQRWANDYLKARGYVTLNQVYDALGIPVVPEGQLLGWVINPPNNQSAVVDFNIQEVARNRFGDPRFLLDFNIQGEIWQMIGED